MILAFICSSNSISLITVQAGGYCPNGQRLLFSLMRFVGSSALACGDHRGVVGAFCLAFPPAASFKLCVCEHARG